MIVIINGPLGVGKTEVAWKLIEKFDIVEAGSNGTA